MNNLSSYCGLVDAKIRASDKDLPVQSHREERQIMVNTTFTSIDDFISAIPEEAREQFCDLVSAEFFGGTLRSTLQSNFSCSAATNVNSGTSSTRQNNFNFPLTVPSVLSFQG